jgi:hypothetical protein
MSSRHRTYSPTTLLFSPGKPVNTASRFTVTFLSASSVAALPTSILGIIPTILIPPDPSKILSSLKQGSVNILRQPSYGSYSSNVPIQPSFYTLYEQYILDIIQFITDKVSLDSILGNLQVLQKEINTKYQAQLVLDQIEHILLGVIDNISHKVSLNIILYRLNHINTLLATVDPSNLPVVYGNVSELLLFVIDEIANKTSLDTILTQLSIVQTGMAAEVQLADEILAFQEIIISIVENIINRTSLTIVMGRLLYLQQRLAASNI